jgi:hypothetical protein
VVQVVELPSKCKALSSNPVPRKYFYHKIWALMSLNLKGLSTTAIFPGNTESRDFQEYRELETENFCFLFQAINVKINSPHPNHVLVLWETRTETPDSEARKQRFIVLAHTRRTHVQRPSPKNRGLSPYLPLQAGFRGNKIKKTRFDPYMVICNFKG